MGRVARGRSNRSPDQFGSSPVADCDAYAFQFTEDLTVQRDMAPIKTAEHFSPGDPALDKLPAFPSKLRRSSRSGPELPRGRERRPEVSLREITRMLVGHPVVQPLLFSACASGREAVGGLLRPWRRDLPPEQSCCGSRLISGNSLWTSSWRRGPSARGHRQPAAVRERRQTRRSPTGRPGRGAGHPHRHVAPALRGQQHAGPDQRGDV